MNGSVLQDRLAQLNTITLDEGPHKTFGDGHCAMEVVAWLAGEGHTDAPECASPVLTSFTISVNDAWATAQRQKLAPYLPRMVGTARDEKDQTRAWLAADWLIRTYAPAWLDLAGLTSHASALRDLHPITNEASAAAAAAPAGAAAAAAAAGYAAGGAAGGAARYAAWGAAGDAAWDAAAAAAADAAWGAAWGAAGDAAAAAAADAARDAARGAAADAAWHALAPTVAALQVSALDLLDRMIDPA